MCPVGLAVVLLIIVAGCAIAEGGSNELPKSWLYDIEVSYFYPKESDFVDLMWEEIPTIPVKSPAHDYVELSATDKIWEEEETGG